MSMATTCAWGAQPLLPLQSPVLWALALMDPSIVRPMQNKIPPPPLPLVLPKTGTKILRSLKEGTAANMPVMPCKWELGLDKGWLTCRTRMWRGPRLAIGFWFPWCWHRIGNPRWSRGAQGGTPPCVTHPQTTQHCTQNFSLS